MIEQNIPFKSSAIEENLIKPKVFSHGAIFLTRLDGLDWD